jgi:hypothetical protein
MKTLKGSIFGETLMSVVRAIMGINILGLSCVINVFANIREFKTDF